VAHLSEKLGGTPSTWAWGRLHSRSFPSITGADGLGYGPRVAGGDPFTEDAADGGLDARTGPSWRMIVSLGRSQAYTWTDANDPVFEVGSAASSHQTLTVSDVGTVYAVGVYPGGQSENPASPWYDNLVPLWWDGKYLPVPEPGRPAGTTTWSLNG
jgi:penicillin amidase